jgi:hypothetical protein
MTGTVNNSSYIFFGWVSQTINRKNYVPYPDAGFPCRLKASPRLFLVSQPDHYAAFVDQRNPHRFATRDHSYPGDNIDKETRQGQKTKQLELKPLHPRFFSAQANRIVQVNRHAFSGNSLSVN